MWLWILWLSQILSIFNVKELQIFDEGLKQKQEVNNFPINHLLFILFWCHKIKLTDITWICAVKDHQVCVRLGPSIKASVQCPRLWPTVIDDAGKDPASDKSSQRQTFRECEQLKPKMEIRNGIAV